MKVNGKRTLSYVSLFIQCFPHRIIQYVYIELQERSKGRYEEKKKVWKRHREKILKMGELSKLTFKTNEQLGSADLKLIHLIVNISLSSSLSFST